MKKNKLYLDSGYLNMDYIMGLPTPYIMVVGGRGTGKTYGALKYVLEHRITFMLMRRTQTAIDLVNKPEFSPIKPVCEDMGLSIKPFPISKGSSAFYDVDEEGKYTGGLPYGYTCALSTISNMRGFSAEDCKICIYDEFIPEKHERPLKNEAAAFYNAYETINRNRELKGDLPLKMLCLANANDIANPLFMDMGLVSRAQKMLDTKSEMWQDTERGITLVMLQHSPISIQKANTALYRLTKDKLYSAMALNNDFRQEYSQIKPQNIIEYKPVCVMGELEIYKHKSKEKYYVTTHRSGSCPVYESTERGIQMFNAHFAWFRLAYYYTDIVVFESPICEILLDKYFKEGAKISSRKA